MTEQEILDALDFQPEEKCGFCDRAADWYLTCRYCNGVTTLCEQHRLAHLRETATRGMILACSRLYIRGDLRFAFIFNPVHVRQTGDAQ